MEKLVIFHANQTCMCLDPHQNFKCEVEISLSPPVIFLLTIPRRYFFCGSFYFVFVFAILSCLCHSALWSPAVKMLTSWLSYI